MPWGIALVLVSTVDRRVRLFCISQTACGVPQDGFVVYVRLGALDGQLSFQGMKMTHAPSVDFVG